MLCYINTYIYGTSLFGNLSLSGLDGCSPFLKPFPSNLFLYINSCQWAIKILCVVALEQIIKKEPIDLPVVLIGCPVQTDFQRSSHYHPLQLVVPLYVLALILLGVCPRPPSYTEVQSPLRMTYISSVQHSRRRYISAQFGCMFVVRFIKEAFMAVKSALE